VGSAEVRQYCPLPTGPTSKNLLKAAVTQWQMSARAYHRTRSVKLARTIADLAGSERIQLAHPSTALRAGVVEAIHASAGPDSWRDSGRPRERRPRQLR